MSLDLRRREMMSKGSAKKYINVYKSIFPVNGFVDNRPNFFLYLTESLPVGTKMHIALTFTTIDSTTVWLQIRDTAASPMDIEIPMPQSSFDVEFEILHKSTNVLYLYFNKSVTNVQIDLSSIKLEQIIDN